MGLSLKLNPTPQIETEPSRFELTDLKIVGASGRRGLGFGLPGCEGVEAVG